MKILLCGGWFLLASAVQAQFAGLVPLWDVTHLGTVAPLGNLPWLENPAAVQSLSVHTQFQPTVPGFTQVSTWVMGNHQNIGWQGSLGYSGNELLSQQYLRLGVSSRINRVQLGGRMGIHSFRTQTPDYPRFGSFAAEIGAWYRLSKEWQTGFWAGGDRWNQFWRIGLGFSPTSTWQFQMEWQGRMAFSTQYAWRPGWQIHVGSTHRIIRSGFTWQSARWTASATLARWPMGWFSSLYSLRYQP